MINNVIDEEDANEIYRKFNSVTSKFLHFEIELFDYITYDREFRLSLNRQELLVNYCKNEYILSNLKRVSDKIIMQME